MTHITEDRLAMGLLVIKDRMNTLQINVKIKKSKDFVLFCFMYQQCFVLDHSAVQIFP